MRRPGFTMLSVIGALFLSTVVLGAAVSLYRAGTRQSDAARARARIQAMAREVSARLRQDVRRAVRVVLPADGGSLSMDLARADSPDRALRVDYRWTPEGLLRSVQPLSGDAPVERSHYDAPLREVRFFRAGPEVGANLRFREAAGGRILRFDLRCAAVPRSRP